MIKKNILVLLAMIGFMYLPASCSKNDGPGTEPAETVNLTVDATDYGKWVYISFATGRSVTKPVEDATPEEWDIALHRYDIKTNGASAYSTSRKDWDSVTDVPLPGSPDPSDQEIVYTADTDGQIITDLSGMTSGNVKYLATPLNSVLCTWLAMEGMPPAFSMSGLVYFIKCSDGKYAKIQFTDYTNDKNENGHISLRYLYPVN